MQRTMDLVRVWSTDHGATFHVSCNKTVVFRKNGFGDMPPIGYGCGSSSITLTPATSKKWLAWMWVADELVAYVDVHVLQSTI